MRNIKPLILSAVAYVLGRYAKQVESWLPTFRDNPSVPSSRAYGVTSQKSDGLNYAAAEACFLDCSSSSLLSHATLSLEERSRCVPCLKETKTMDDIQNISRLYWQLDVLLVVTAHDRF
jgi:hypothetical protein